MELISKINYEISRMPNIKRIDPRQLPCQFCVEPWCETGDGASAELVSREYKFRKGAYGNVPCHITHRLSVGNADPLL
jgi:hypothetical protein